MSCHPLSVYTKFQINIFQSMLIKSAENLDGRMDIATA